MSRKRNIKKEMFVVWKSLSFDCRSGV